MEFLEFENEFIAANTKYYSGFCSIKKWFCSENANQTQQLKAAPALNIKTR